MNKGQTPIHLYPNIVQDIDFLATRLKGILKQARISEEEFSGYI